MNCVTGSERCLAFRLAYRGDAFHGMQVQPRDRTVQGALEDCLSRFWKQSVRIRFAGRTDAGVHATGQVVAFEVPNAIPLAALRKLVNTQLGGDAVLLEGWEAVPGFHPRFQASLREYVYLLSRGPRRPDPFRGSLVHCLDREVDWDLAREAAPLLLGTHDYTAFCTRPAVEERPVRSLDQLEIWERGPLVGIRVVGRSFLRGMVRHLVGALLRVARGDRPSPYIRDLLERGSRGEKDDSLEPAPPTGLYLTGVEYPEGLPGPLLVPPEVPIRACWWEHEVA